MAEARQDPEPPPPFRCPQRPELPLRGWDAPEDPRVQVRGPARRAPHRQSGEGPAARGGGARAGDPAASGGPPTLARVRSSSTASGPAPSCEARSASARPETPHGPGPAAPPVVTLGPAPRDWSVSCKEGDLLGVATGDGGDRESRPVLAPDLRRPVPRTSAPARLGPVGSPRVVRSRWAALRRRCGSSARKGQVCLRRLAGGSALMLSYGPCPRPSRH